MCGIAGIVGSPRPESDSIALRRMNAALSARGPDDEGFHFDTGALLAHRRLSIIDLASGHQPMLSACGRYAVVFNGEIYNFKELRAKLEKEGAAFRTRSDTEVLVELFAREGPSCVKRLNGMFAFAVWDKLEKTLFAARDRAGKKPFYYAEIKGNLLFASELKAILAHPDVARRMEPASLRAFLAYEYVPAPLSMIQGVKKLPAAHAMTWKKGQCEILRYWTPPFGNATEDDATAASKRLLELLDGAVERRLVSDVPLGVFLSGGIDSSAVVALMARHREGKDIRTFSIEFAEASYDESSHSRYVARLFGTDHASETLSASTMLDILPEVVAYLDEPFADGSILPTYLLSRFTRRHVTVALGGDGGDELFAGYPTFVASRVADLYRGLPSSVKRAVEGGVALLKASERNMSLDFKLRQFLKGATHEGVIRNQVWLSAVPPEEQAALFTQEAKDDIAGDDPYSLIREEMAACPSNDPGDRLLYFYLKFYLCDDILFKTDRASMANSLEVRAPFLDVNVMEYALRLPFAFKLKGLTTKYILKKALRDVLPRRITRRSKKGFGIPIAGWFRRELKPLLEQTLSPERLQRDGIFNTETVRALIAGHIEGRVNNRKPLFALLMLHLWMDRWLGKPAG